MNATLAIETAWTTAERTWWDQVRGKRLGWPRLRGIMHGSLEYNSAVFQRVLERMRAKIRARQYVMTVHAWEEMESDGLSIFDVESAILSGKIVERQSDRPWGDRKYVVRGRPLEGDDSVVVVAKLGPTGQVVVLTVYTE